MSVDRFREFLGIGPSSLAGNKALGRVAATLKPVSPDRKQLMPIEGSLPSPFNLAFRAEGEGYFTDREETIYLGYKRPSVTIILPDGREDTYQAERLTGIVRCSSDEFSSRPLTPQDAAMLEAAAQKTAILKARRDHQAEQDTLKAGVLKIAPFLHQAIANRVPSSGFDTGWDTHAHKVLTTLTKPLFNLRDQDLYAVISGFEEGVDPRTHEFGVIRRIDPLRAEAYRFSVGKIGPRGSNFGRLEVIKKFLPLAEVNFADLSKKDLTYMIASGNSSPFVPTDAEFLKGVSQWIENPISPEDFGVEFSQGPWTSVTFRKSPSEIITATISGDTRQTGTKFTTSENRPGEQSSIVRPSSLAEITTILDTLATAGTKLQSNPWFRNESSQIIALLSGSKITIRQLINPRTVAETTTADDSGLNKVVLEGTLGWLNVQVTNLTAMQLLQTL